MSQDICNLFTATTGKLLNPLSQMENTQVPRGDIKPLRKFIPQNTFSSNLKSWTMASFTWTLTFNVHINKSKENFHLKVYFTGTKTFLFDTNLIRLAFTLQNFEAAIPDKIQNLQIHFCHLRYSLLQIFSLISSVDSVDSSTQKV